jgi:hypothetical protein
MQRWREVRKYDPGFCSNFVLNSQVEPDAMRANTIVSNLDRNLAIFTLILSALLVCLLSLKPETVIQAGFIVYIFFACIAYLVIRPRLSAREVATPPIPYMRGRAYLLLNIMFFVTFAYAVFSVALRTQPYTRPLDYFVSIGVLAGLLAVESLLLPAKQGYEYIILAKVILVGILMRWVPQVMFPGGIWFDSWFHERLVREMLRTSHITGLGALPYSKLPVMHLLLGSTMLLTGMDFETAFMLVVSPLQVIVQAIFTYSLAVGFISGKRPALLAALLVTVADVVMAKGIVAYPNTLAMILLIVIVHTIFRARQSASTKLSVLCLLLMGTLILTHTIASLALAILLLCFWLGFGVYQWMYCTRVKVPPVNFFLFALFVVAMLSWWMYASGHIMLLAKSIQWAFQVEHFQARAPAQAIAYSLEIPISEVLLDRVGFSMYYALAIIGCLYLMSKKATGSGHGFMLALGGCFLTAIGFFSPVLHAYVLPVRWHFMSQVMLAIPAALGIILISGVADKHRALLIGALVGLLSFSMVADVAANFDTPILSSARLIRVAFTESELQSMDTITDLWRGTIASDQHSNAYLSSQRDVETLEINEPLDVQDFLTLKGSMLLIREYITSKPFYAGGKAWMLGYDPIDILMTQRFEQVYDSGSVTAFYRE